MAKFHISSETETETYLMFFCPGCECGHQVPVNRGPRAWQWNGKLDAATLQPSILVNRGSMNPTQPICHSYVTEGKIQFLADCTHKLAGQTVEAPDWDAV